MDTYIAQLIRLGYTVGLAQDHSDNPEVDIDHVYSVTGFGVQTHVSDEETMRSLVEGHDERVRQMKLTDEERLREARSSAE